MTEGLLNQKQLLTFSSDNPPMKHSPTASQPSQKENQGSQNAGNVTHYENFPVASMLCPAHLRPAVVAIYNFARTADDLADEGEASPAERSQALALYKADLAACARVAQPHTPQPLLRGPPLPPPWTGQPVWGPWALPVKGASSAFWVC